MLIIGIAGGTGSGKTTVVKKLTGLIDEQDISLIPQDSYYKDHSHLNDIAKKDVNFDHPESIEFTLLEDHIKRLRQGNSIDRPIYSYLTCTRSDETIPIDPKNVLILEGILLFTNKAIVDLCDIKIFVDAPADDRLIRVIKRDIMERGRNIEEVLERYEKTVKPMHEQFIEPSKKYADIIVPQGGLNNVAIEVIASTIQMKLKEAIR